MTKSELTLSRKSLILIIFLLTITALLLRVKYVEQTVIDNPVRADARQYVIYGYNLYAKGIYSQQLNENPAPDSYRSPGYPLFMALAFWVSGKSGYYAWVIYSQTLLGSLLVPLTFLVGRRFLSVFKATVGSFLVAVSPHLVSMTSYLLTETLFSFLLLVSIYAIILAVERNTLIFFIIAALIGGLSYLANETALFLPFIFAGVGIIYLRKAGDKRRPRKTIVNLSIYLLIFCLFPIAWVARNQSLPPGGMKSGGRAIATMSHGAYPDFIYKSPEYRYFPYREDPMQPEFGSNLKSFSKILYIRFKERPVRYISWYLFEKPYYLWSWNILQGQGDVYIYPVKKSFYMNHIPANILRLFMKYLHPLFIVGIFFGVLLSLKKYFSNEVVDINISFQLIIVVYYTMLYTVFAPWPRYSVPLRPEMYLFALWALGEMKPLIQRKG